jgi:hypothetical protein
MADARQATFVLYYVLELVLRLQGGGGDIVGPDRPRAEHSELPDPRRRVFIEIEKQARRKEHT